MKKFNYSTFDLKINKKTIYLSKRTLSCLLLMLFCTLIGYGQSAPFITVWEIDDTEIIIPAEGGYFFTWAPIDDPDNPTVPQTMVDETTVSFPEPGTYIIEMIPTDIYGTALHRFKLNNTGDKERLIEISQWGDAEWTSFEKAFYGAENLEITADDTPDLSNVTNMSYAFASTGIQEISTMDDWDVSQVTNMRSIFNGAEDFNSNLESWNTSNVNNMRDMFFNASSFNQPLNQWDISNVTDMRGVFKGATSFNQALDNWEMNNVSNTAWMFRGASEFNQDISNWDMSGIDSEMNNMFEGATSFNQDLNSWDVSNVAEMKNMFANASSFNQNLDNWNLNNLTAANSIFDNSGIDCENYSQTLEGWANNPDTASDITLGAEEMEYSAEIEEHRNILINDLGWILEGDTEGTCTLSVNDQVKIAFDIYPNPVQETLRINGLEGSESIKLFDVNGRLIQSFRASNQKESINMDDFTSGIYFLNIEMENQIQTTKKIIKQ